jgi:hypothetical protein
MKRPCKVMVLYVSPASSTVPLHTALNDVMVGRSELCISNRLRSQIQREIVRESEVAVEAIRQLDAIKSASSICINDADARCRCMMHFLLH